MYFYLAESLVKVRPEAEALPYFEKLVDEFERASTSRMRGSGSTLKARSDATAAAP